MLGDCCSKEKIVSHHLLAVFNLSKELKAAIDVLPSFASRSKRRYRQAKEGLSRPYLLQASTKMALESYTFGPYKIRSREVFYSANLSYALLICAMLFPNVARQYGALWEVEYVDCRWITIDLYIREHAVWRRVVFMFLQNTLNLIRRHNWVIQAYTRAESYDRVQDVAELLGMMVEDHKQLQPNVKTYATSVLGVLRQTQIPPRARILSRKYQTLVSSRVEPLQEEAELGHKIDYMARYIAEGGLTGERKRWVPRRGKTPQKYVVIAGSNCTVYLQK